MNASMLNAWGIVVLDVPPGPGQDGYRVYSYGLDPKSGKELYWLVRGPGSAILLSEEKLKLCVEDPGQFQGRREATGA